jgi:hypothetical protein
MVENFREMGGHSSKYVTPKYDLSRYVKIPFYLNTILFSLS